MRFPWFLAFFIATPAFANDVPFGVWEENFKKDALAQGIPQATLDEAFKDVAPIDQIITLDRAQPEGTKTLPEYLETAVNTGRIVEGKRLLADNAEVLSAIESKYDVDKGVIVALWGIETSYGENTGNYSLIGALSTLAYDGRRSDYFRGELINALKIMEQDHIAPDAMSSSWAGAMGQCQFMPTSFLKYAVDYNHDGKRDIWNTTEDVFASIANYLSKEGWEKGGDLAIPIVLPEGFSDRLIDIDTTKTTREWKKLGVTLNDGSDLPDDRNEGSVILVGRDADAVPYLVYNNFKVILKWNRSRYFATAVDLLMEEMR